MQHRDYLAVKREEEALSDEEISVLNAMTIDTGRHRLPKLGHFTCEQALKYHEQIGYTAIVVRRGAYGVEVAGLPDEVPGYLQKQEKAA